MHIQEKTINVLKVNKMPFCRTVDNLSIEIEVFAKGQKLLVLSNVILRFLSNDSRESMI